MNSFIATTSRKRFIQFGQVLGVLLRETDPDKQWIIHLGDADDSNSGKSLIALAIDTALNPERYPHGLGEKLSADDLLKPGNNGQAQIVFKNFYRCIEFGKTLFDAALAKFKDQNSDAKILVASNIERRAVGSFDYIGKGLDSDLLDINIEVHRLPGEWQRVLTITAKDEQLLRELEGRFTRDILPAAIMEPVPYPQRPGFDLKAILMPVIQNNNFKLR